MHLRKKNNILGSKLILVVEDIEINQKLVKIFAESWGCVVEIADNGLIGVEMIARNNYDLVLMDINMPVMDGVQATKIIRSWNNEKADIPIIAVTANSSPEEAKIYKSVGIDDIVDKPIDEKLLFDKISNLLVEKSMIETVDEKLLHSVENPIYSLDHIRSITNDEELIKELVASCLKPFQNYKDELAKFSEANDWVSLEKVAHAIRATVINIHSTKALELCMILKHYDDADARKLKSTANKLIQVLEITEVVLRKEVLA